MPDENVVVIGAGPFGLSIGAHLGDLGAEYRIVGRPMDTWKAHMPTGMQLRSEPYGSDMAAPQPGFDVRAYSRLHGLDYVARLGPLSIERFRDYADWYTGQLVPDVQDLTVTDVASTAAGFRVAFAEAEPVTAHQVVVATGILPYATLPNELAGLPADLATHTADHHNLHRFKGREVAVVGGGQSALETAALLHEAGAHVRVIMRGGTVRWLQPNPEHVGFLGHARRPVNKLCEGWHCAIWNSPAAFRRLPQAIRIEKARTVLGPAGAWWLKDRVEGVVEVLSGHSVRGAAASGSGVRLELEGPKATTLQVDHVIAGTGFTVDITRLPFLPAALCTRIATLNGYPVLNRSGESTVPGLYFAGAPAAVSLGPSVRFIAGTHNSARLVARSAARRSSKALRAATLPFNPRTSDGRPSTRTPGLV
jgi:FAD-dependent urate hydroxylase